MSDDNDSRRRVRQSTDQRDWTQDDLPTVDVQVRPVPPSGELVPCFVVVSGGQIGRVFALRADEAVIGRGSEADICLAESSISRRHALVYKDEQHLVSIRDLGSTNGTFVNGVASAEQALSAGDRVQLGKVVMVKFEYHTALEDDFLAQLYDAGVTDPGTGIFNRRYFDTHLQADFSLSSRHGTPLTLVVFDLDYFKLINDTHGHPVGDAVLRQFANLLRSRCRVEDIVARYGGEEFVLILRHTTRSGAEQLVRDLLKRTATHVFRHAGCEVHITASAGIASTEGPDLYPEPQALLAAADAALYRAKASGRNRVELDTVEPLPA